MANAIFNNIHIGGIACAVPEKVEKITDYIDQLGENEVYKFIETTGVKERHCVTGNQTTSDLCFVAAEQLMKEKQIDKESIDALIFLTQSPDYFLPATSHVLHKRLGLSKNCIAFDINLGCSGYVYGLYLASTMLQGGSIKRVLFLAGEMSVGNPETSIKDVILFGHAGTATLIERGNTEMKCLLKANGEGYSSLITPGGCVRNPITDSKNYYKQTAYHMDGPDVFGFTITEVPRAFKEFFDLYGGNINDYDYCVLHQANLLILKQLARKLKLPLEKMPISLDRYANTSSASIPLVIVDLCEREQVPETINLISSGFGVGLSWGVTSFEVESKNVLPMIYTSDYYKEAFRG
ncbi:ketoacyl-ACP synthase III [Paenibacillus thiaminolyticus]|uniref:3-oxoacyl-ACP synthase III family protein n=1 Tax=Paenibacillus thiaminolyticus TaxID=49283 RepID=UPI003D2A2AAD